MNYKQKRQDYVKLNNVETLLEQLDQGQMSIA